MISVMFNAFTQSNDPFCNPLLRVFAVMISLINHMYKFWAKI